MILHRSDLIYVHELSWKKGGGDNINSIITCAALPSPQARGGIPPTRSLLTGYQMADEKEGREK